MKKINFGTVLKNLKGEDIKDKDGVLTAGDVVSNILSASKPANPQKDVIKQYKLALKVVDSKEDADFEDAEVEMMVEVMRRNELQYTTLIAGQVLTILGQ
jgi:hypothetical protein